MFVTTNTSFAVRKVCLSQQNFCRDKHLFVVTKHVFCRDKSMLVATNTRLSRQKKKILMAAPANGTRFLVDGVEDCVCLHQSLWIQSFCRRGCLEPVTYVSLRSYTGARALGFVRLSHTGSMCLTLAVCVSHGHCVSHSYVCLTWVVYVSHGSMCLTAVSHMGSICLTWAVCVSQRCVSHVGSVRLTWAVCVSRGQCMSHVGSGHTVHTFYFLILASAVHSSSCHEQSIRLFTCNLMACVSPGTVGLCG